ncbi:division abnormally delayed protein isoform X1 [Pieris brassicae]|uniref:division abnormally delayed protein isoform X1 n=1 Tax=Pieris brassicae TaxID=7116 RepID=UPI001E660C23|nr:division abnormally delayed protein isoform X1 [Pieris brassicae]
MRCAVLVCLAACWGCVAAAPASCLEHFFVKHNVTADDSQQPGPICGGQCCGRGREIHLTSTLRHNAEDKIAAATRPIAELLLATRRTLQEHLTALSHQSQNKTAALLSQLYRSHATRAHAPLATLYDDIRTLLRSNLETEDAVDLASPPPKEMAQSTKKFFREVFPVAYQNVLRLDTKQFTTAYEACLKDAYDAVQPFGDVPEQLGSSLAKSLEAARALLQVLGVGAGALGGAEGAVKSAAHSHYGRLLLKMGGCSRCQGHDVSPCKNYCLNVARGCIGSIISELDAPWASYVEGVERLARADADAALRALDARVSEAIMYALENHVILEKKVRQECGPPSTLESPNLPPPSPTGSSRRDALRAPPPDTELLQFAATLAATKKLFASMADRLCDDPDFATDGNENCWNGDTVGEYTKALVASASMSDQKYNPEMTETASNPEVAILGERLRQARQLLVLHSWSGNLPAAEAFMQGDEAGDEGSGSGRLYTDDDAAYDAEGSGEEGSGTPDIAVSRTITGEETTYSAPPKISGASTRSVCWFMVAILVSSVVSI